MNLGNSIDALGPGGVGPFSAGPIREIN